MKAKILLTTIGLSVVLGSGTLSARTWTSSDGSKTFQGEFVSYDADASQVTVRMRNGKSMTFGADKLSAEDQKWAKSAQGETAAGAVADEIADQKVGGKLTDTLKKLEDGQFVDFTFTEAPEYYLLYFTASW